MMNQKASRAVLYARVSTLLGQDPENQLIHLRQFAENRGFQLVGEFVDKGVSGARERRPALDQLVKDARMGKFKVVVVAAIDRLARNTRHLLNLLHELQGYGVTVVSLRENIQFDSAIGSAFVTICGVLSSLERELCAERIRNALAAKKMKAHETGWKCGRPAIVTPEIAEQVCSLRATGLSLRAIERKLNKIISRTSIVRILKQNQPK